MLSDPQKRAVYDAKGDRGLKRIEEVLPERDVEKPQPKGRRVLRDVGGYRVWGGGDRLVSETGRLRPLWRRGRAFGSGGAVPRVRRVRCIGDADGRLPVGAAAVRRVRRVRRRGRRSAASAAAPASGSRRARRR